MCDLRGEFTEQQMETYSSEGGRGDDEKSVH